MRNTLANENQELHAQLNLEAMKGQTERSKVKAEVEELLAERSNYVNQTKKFSELIGNSQGILQQVSADLLVGLDTYREHLVPILETNMEIFGSELCRVVFPRFGIESIAEHPEHLLQWTNTFKEFIAILAKEIEHAKRYTTNIKSQLSEAENTVDNLSSKIKMREDEVMRLKEVNKSLNEDKGVLNKRLKSIEGSIESYSMEALSSERRYKDDNDTLNMKMQELSAQNERLESEVKEWMSTAETSNVLVNALEQKIKQISDEKKDYELLLTK
jgi:chromosome segregation ATPase